MKKQTLLSLLLLIFSVFFAELFGQCYDSVKILPGQGIVYNNDSILLNRTTVKELHQKLKIKDKSNPNALVFRNWSGYDEETGEEAHWNGIIREVKFKSIVFEFSTETNKDSLKLKLIEIQENKTIKIYTDNGLEMRMINPNIKDVFPNLNLGKRDYISESGLTYNLYTYGISFQLEKMENGDLKIIEISVHWKYE